MTGALDRFAWPWAGLIGGPVLWYAAHDLAFYLSAVNCRYPFIVPAIHLVAFLGALLCGLLSYRARLPDEPAAALRQETFGAMIGAGAAALFALAIAWQGLAVLAYSGCER